MEPIQRAVWYPFWYGLDQTIAVDAVDDFDFFVIAPTRINTKGLPLFYHGDWSEECRPLYESRRARIISISHPSLGAIRKIECAELQYTLIMADGRVLKVDAEEDTGSVRDVAGDLLEPIGDWQIFVALEPVQNSV